MKEKELSLLPPALYLETIRSDYQLSRKSAFEFRQTMRQTCTKDSYSYKPFDDTKSLFIHIPKCAGVSVSKALYGNLAGGHTTLEEYLVIFEPQNSINFFKFTIVRNPWDRVVSAYHFLKQGGFGKKDTEWFTKELTGFHDFDAFVTHWLTKVNIWKWRHFMPQYHFMQDKRKKIALDFIGFFENIADDFGYIADRLGIDARLSFENKSTHGDYRDYYTNRTREIVAHVYEKDIELLGYQFDNSSICEQLRSRPLP